MITQVSMAFFGLLSLAMAYARSPAVRKWSPFVGLLGQPAWIYFAWKTNAGGVMALSGAYTAVYLRAVVKNWGAK